jgi:hypothetical protein
VPFDRALRHQRWQHRLLMVFAPVNTKTIGVPPRSHRRWIFVL